MDCAYHSVTAMVGAGVLGLPGVMSTLGWAGGLLALAASLFVSWCAKASAEGQGGGQGTRSARRRAVSPRRPSLWFEQRATRGGAPCARTNTPNAPEHALETTLFPPPQTPPPTHIHTRWTYALLVQMHEVPDLDAKPGSGGWRRFDRYQDLASYVLGPVKGWFALVPFQIAVCLGMCITYSVVGSEDLHAAVNDWSGGKAPAQWVFYLCFMGLQLVLSQLPDFSSLGIVSLVGALMSLGYCAIAVVLSLMLKPAADVTYAPLANEAGGSAMEKAFAVFNALSTIMFAVSAAMEREGEGAVAHGASTALLAFLPAVRSFFAPCLAPTPPSRPAAPLTPHPSPLSPLPPPLLPPPLASNKLSTAATTCLLRSRPRCRTRRPCGACSGASTSPSFSRASA